MVIVMEPTATEEQIQKVIEALVEVGYDVHRSTGVSHTVLGAVGSPRIVVDPRLAGADPGRARGDQDLRALQAGGAHLQVRGHHRGHRGREGRRRPRSSSWPAPARWRARSRSVSVARAVAASGARVLRGGAFKPRTSPYAFQGHGEEALRWMRARPRTSPAWP